MFCILIITNSMTFTTFSTSGRLLAVKLVNSVFCLDQTTSHNLNDVELLADGDSNPLRNEHESDASGGPAEIEIWNQTQKETRCMHTVAYDRRIRDKYLIAC